MSTTDEPDYVSAEACAEFRERFADGATYTRLAFESTWSSDTVRYHIVGECSHDASHQPDDRVLAREHLTHTTLPGVRPPVSKPEEAYCWDCRSRITITPDGLEVGHRTKRVGRHGRCKHRPDDGVDPATGSNSGRRSA